VLSREEEARLAPLLQKMKDRFSIREVHPNPIALALTISP